jgi:predicted AlkP superfamily phosphohydrolase/phosphomutase
LRRELIKKFFRRVDASINRILGLHSSESKRANGKNEPRVLRLICSDHGHGSSDGRIFVNNLLEEWGFLKRLAGLSKLARRMKSLSLKRADRKASNKELAVDWKRTRAYMAHVGIHGYVYLNLKGREPHGIVKPAEFENVRDELVAKFQALRIPGTDQPLFRAVYKGEAIYARKEEHALPDIVLAATGGFFPRSKLSKKKAIQVAPKAIGGVHRPEGVYALAGDGVRPSKGLGGRASIADICPTLLAALGQPIPGDVVGKPMQFVFEKALPVRIDAQTQSAAGAASENVYSQDEQREIEKRLGDLGYLE